MSLISDLQAHFQMEVYTEKIIQSLLKMKYF